jgi:hypothetical protein
MIGRLLASSVSRVGLPASAGPSLTELVEHALFRKQPGEPTKKATRGLRPRMAFVLAGVTGADQAPTSPAESNSIILHKLSQKKPSFLGPWRRNSRRSHLASFCIGLHLDHCKNARLDCWLEARPDIYYLGKFSGQMDV